MGMIETILSLAPAVVGDAASAYSAIKAFLASPAGKDLEARLGSLFTHTPTPGAAVVVEPKAAS